MISNLQYLRAFCAINVALSHMIAISGSYGYNPHFLSFLRDWGASGVDIFFVISGFIMVYIQDKHNRNVFEFIKLRFIRIVPVYWIITSLVIYIYILIPDFFRSYVIDFEWGLFSYIFLSSYILDKAPIINPGWTIEWEIFFYIVFGFSLYFKNLTQSLIFVFVVLLFFAIVSSPIVLEFVGGIIIGLIYKKYSLNIYLGIIGFLLGCTLILLSLLMVIPDAMSHRVLLWGIPSLLIVYGAVNIKQIHSKVGLFIGDASYSIYLVQILTIPAFYKLLSGVKFSLFNNDFLILICLVITVISSIVAYLFLEKPLISYMKRKY